MEASAPAEVYYFISDLHIGGVGELDCCEFEPELIDFLKQVATEPRPAELIIVGDLFGLWEMVDTPSRDKIRRLAENHPALFSQFRETGQRVRITLIPGNHDYELAWVEDFGPQLREHNIHLEPVIHITRDLAGRRLWIEHGNQHDPFNRFADFGDPHANPFGYYVVANVCASAGRISTQSRSHWLHDVESVYPNEDIPFWVVSNYFYKEMAPILRWFAFPFLLFFGLGGLLLGGLALEGLDLLERPLVSRHFGELIGFPGKVFELVLAVDGVVLLILLALAVPARVLLADFKRVLRRLRVDQGIQLRRTKEAAFLNAARAVFEADPQVAVFIYGHTHRPSLRWIGDRCVINTGTWLKRLVRVKPVLGFLPGVFIPHFHLNYYRIDQAGSGALRIRYYRIPKAVDRDLTWMQRLAIWRKDWADLLPIPEETILPGRTEPG